jgi:hypothetical protein
MRVLVSVALSALVAACGAAPAPPSPVPRPDDAAARGAIAQDVTRCAPTFGTGKCEEMLELWNCHDGGPCTARAREALEKHD